MELLVVVLIGLLYMFPSFVAAMRHHQNSGAIFLLNLTLGWSGACWIVALVWACTAVRHEVVIVEREKVE